MGNGSVIAAGNLQYMSACNGVSHSAFNPSGQQRGHILQIWLLPDERGCEPRCVERSLSGGLHDLQLLCSGKPRDAAIHTDAEIYLGRLAARERTVYPIAPSRSAWIHLISDRLELGSAILGPEDGASIEDATRLEIDASSLPRSWFSTCVEEDRPSGGAGSFGQRIRVESSLHQSDEQLP